MKVEQLLNILNTLLKQQKIFTDTVIDINDGNGIYISIDNLGIQEWTDRDGLKHKVVTLFTKPYDQKESIL